METIKQIFAEPIIAILTIATIGLTILGVAGVFSNSFRSAIVTDEAFKVVSDTSKYSCIVSEIDNDLLLKCLKVK